MTDKEMRELDAWIAEHVMGWRLSTRGGSWRSTDPGWIDSENELQRIQENWKPSTDPAAALEVLKKCADKSDMPIEIDRKRDNGGPWRVETGVLSQGLVAIAPRDQNTLELAICLFAKKLFSK